MSYIKCQVCGEKATWMDLSSQIDYSKDPAFCAEHLPLDCNCEDCKKFVDFDENGKRTETCMWRSFEFNKRGWKKAKDLPHCYDPC